MISIGTVILLLAIASYIFAWQRHTIAREAVICLAQNLCAKNNWQLLDDSVHYQKLQLQKNTKGNWYVERIFQFEFLAENSQERRIATIHYFKNGRYSFELGSTQPQHQDKKDQPTTPSSLATKYPSLAQAPKNKIIELEAFRKMKSSNDSQKE